MIRIAMLGVAALALTAGSALADDTANVKIIGKIEAKCVLDVPNGGAVIDLGVLNTGSAKNAEIPLTITCNAPYQESFKSQYGGLYTTATVPSGFPANANLIPYGFGWNGHALVTIDQPVGHTYYPGAGDGAPGGAAFTYPPVYNAPYTVKAAVSINPADIADKVPGNYEDTITVTFDFAPFGS
ncbi:hypothetical protein [Zavarzinia sp. CC-PAN008]|uniref:hypothetical protein n=1 Tax=Zavarzinia sp. CC-PAN008 TaxID=3243332 RepID=UPI003F7430FB